MIDDLLLRQALLQQYANGYAEQIVSLYEPGDKRLIAAVRNFFDDATPADIAELLRQNESRQSVKILLDEIRAITAEQNKDVIAAATLAMLALVEAEATATAEIVGAEDEQPPKAQDVISLPVLGLGIVATWAALNARYLINVISTVTNAAQEGVDPVPLLRGTKDQNYKDGLFFARNNQVERTAETQANGVSNNTQSAVFAALALLVDAFIEEEWIATLDHKTCQTCGNLDGRRFKIGRGTTAPVHPRCRCLRVPVLAGSETRTRYIDWFERRTETAKRSILGKTRYELYKSGELELNEFVNDRTQKLYTIDELNDIYNISRS